MLNSTFCHLHVHNHYSVLDGFGTEINYAARAKELGFRYIGLTNHGNVDGLIQWQKACDKHDVFPILGCEAYIVPDAKIKRKSEERGHITLLIKNRKGWRNLLQMMSYAHLEGFYYRPRIDYETLLKHIDGLVILSGCADSFVLKSLKYEDGFVEILLDAMPDTRDFYLEIMPHKIDIQKKVNDTCIKLKEKLGVQLVATNDCHYIYDDEWVTHEVLLAIQRKKHWDDEDRWKFGFTGLHLRTADEMAEAFESVGVDTLTYLRAMKNTIEIAEKCYEFRIQKRPIKLPHLPQLNGRSPDHFLKELCYQNFKALFNKELEDEPEYQKRFLEEYELLKNKAFCDYFLICWELVSWCRKNNILIGPGRGSVGGSLIAYLLGITAVDPIKHDLLFSRFISTDRIDYPDIDIDFQKDKRHLVREHLQELYGEGTVVGISSFLTMKARAAIRDVSRVFKIPYNEVDKFAKSIDDTPDADQKARIKHAIETTEEGKQFQEKYPEVVKHAMKLEGQIKAHGQHAAGLVLSPEPLSDGDYGHLADRNNTMVINWNMEDAEHVGLIKLDVLGLDMLSIFAYAKELIKKNYGVNINYDEIVPTDKKVLKEFAKGNNVGCFQFNSKGMTNLCQELGVSHFEHLVAANALYRPGPLRAGMVDKYIKRKKGASWYAIHPIMKKITQSTFGIIIYQEQVMQVAHQIGGLSLVDAERMRKIIGKSKGAAELNKFREAFIHGCTERKILNRRDAESLWEQLETFGGYGFNRSHAVEYSLLGYYCQWLKTYYPTEFICATLTFCGDDKKDEAIKEAYRLGLSVVTPKVGISDAIKWTVKEKKLYVPFKEVKGIGDKTAIKVATETNEPIPEPAIEPEKEVLNVKKKPRLYKGFWFEKREPIPEQIQEKRKAKKKKLTRLQKILHDIEAFDPNSIPADATDYFSFQISSDPKIAFPKLYELVNKRVRPSEFEKILKGKMPIAGAIQQKRFTNEKVLVCNKCDLRLECRAPVMPSRGKYNVVICGEAPGKDEDNAGSGFVGSAGKNILWPELEKYGLSRILFHVTNCVKCYPSKTKTPKKKHIVACQHWLLEELNNLDTRLILAFGNTCLSFFTNTASGITNVTGETHWNEKFKAWICWCIHPASVLHNPGNRRDFEKGIKNFAETMFALQGKER